MDANEIAGRLTFLKDAHMAGAHADPGRVGPSPAIRWAAASQPLVDAGVATT